MFNPMTLFPKQNLFVLLIKNLLDKPPMFIYLVKYRVFMHLWATDFRVFTVGRRTPSLTATTGSFTRGGIYLFLLCPTHVFSMLRNHETHFGRCPITELTTHLLKMMNDHNHAHTPNTMRCPHAYAMQKFQCMYLMLHV